MRASAFQVELFLINRNCATTTRTATSAAAKRVMRAKAELKRLERKPTQASGAATQASTGEP